MLRPIGCATLLALVSCLPPGSSPASSTASAPPVSSRASAPSASSTASAPPPAISTVLVGAGDIAFCESDRDEATAALVDAIAGTVFTLGDNAYPDGGTDAFAQCYDPSWGRFAGRTRPSAGNHEYETADASAYFAYFGAAAGVAGAGWYSYDIGAWHVIVLNSNCDAVGGCQAGSAQADWLAADLAAHPAECTLAYWHHPRWSSGQHGSDDQTDGLWRLLAEAGADLVLTAHDHLYERFVPMDANGVAAPQGMVEFVVGTGGRSLYEFHDILPTSAVHDNQTYGVLILTLRPGAYDWEFLPVLPADFTDVGSADCH